MKTLIIVESPTKATKIQSILGNSYKVLASYGHICDLAKGGSNGMGIDTNDNFKTKYHIIKEKQTVLQNIIDAAEDKDVDKIILLSDADREGVAISYHLKKYLSTINKPINFSTIHEITKDGIKTSLENVGEVDINLVNAQEARRVLDRIIGFSVSPYLMRFYGNNLSSGRVISVCVRLITDRENDISSFIPEEYWNIAAKFSTSKNETFIARFDKKPSNKTEADNFIAQIKSQPFAVLSISSQKKKEKPPAPMITSVLQQYMAKKHSFEPERTMNAAQSLYENGFCTYIRTDSTRISDEAISSVRDYIKDNNFDLPKSPNTYEDKIQTQGAHECIRPVSLTQDISTLPPDEKTLYDVIWKFFVASQMNPAIYDTVNIKIASKDKSLSFSVSGKALSYKGYLELFGVDLSKISLPNLSKNEILSLLDVKSEQKFTKPPPRYNDATLLEELDKRGIGRPSTFADIIKKISARNYVEKSNNIYKPTELGKKITDVLIKSFNFMDYNYTSLLEKKLDDIAEGKLNHLDMLKDFFFPFKKYLDQAYIKKGTSICDKCGSPMLERTSSKNQETFIGCSSFPNCKNIKKVEKNSAS
jgi:DNA topoisomerase I